MNEEMQKTGRLGRRTWDVALVFSRFLVLSLFQRAVSREINGPQTTLAQRSRIARLEEAWMLEADLSLCTGQGEELEDKQFWGQVEAMAGMITHHAGQEAYVVRWIGEKGKAITLSWYKGHFYASDSHPSLVQFSRPGDFARQLGIFSQD